jgi:cyclopropane-fatty-acyl-phospholipid synthase
MEVLPMSPTVISAPSTKPPKSRLDQGRFGVGAAVARLPKPATAATQPPGRVRDVERWLARRLLQSLGDPPVNIVLWDGQPIGDAQRPSAARVVVRDRATFWKLFLRPELQFGDAYTAGRIEVEGELLSLLETVFRSLAARRRPAGGLRRAFQGCVCRAPSNTLAGSRNNIHHHYDIGNDFYKLWLDDEMVYTCAYFPDLVACGAGVPPAGQTIASTATTLEQAQAAKMDLVCRKLWLRPGETVVEAGCGWGGLARHMARHFGVTVKAYNVSHEQIQYARQRARDEGLNGRIEYIEDDYRNVTGRFDAFVSVGMLEHVGADHYHELGATIERCLAPAGRGLIHSIGRDQPGRIDPWIERRIFPGAHPPALREMLGVLEPFRLSVLDVENLRLHYAETLRHWLARFDAAEEAVTRMFDQRFVRAWRLYLTGSIAAFTTGTLQLFQVLFSRPGVSQVPWTRERMRD